MIDKVNLWNPKFIGYFWSINPLLGIKTQMVI